MSNKPIHTCVAEATERARMAMKAKHNIAEAVQLQLRAISGN